MLNKQVVNTASVLDDQSILIRPRRVEGYTSVAFQRIGSHKIHQLLTFKSANSSVFDVTMWTRQRKVSIDAWEMIQEKYVMLMKN